MKIEINIQKKHFVILLISMLLIGGLIFTVAQPASNPGHSINEVSGASPNCLSSPTHPSCTATFGSTWLINHGGLGNVSLATASAFSLEGFRASAFCRSDGSNCPTTPSQYARKVPSNSFCGPGNAFYCGAQPVNVVVDPFTFATSTTPVTPFFDFSVGVYKAGSASGANCQWVLCAS